MDKNTNLSLPMDEPPLEVYDDGNIPDVDLPQNSSNILPQKASPDKEKQGGD